MLGTILSPREGYTCSLEDRVFWQRCPMNKEINTDAFQWGRVLCRQNCEVGGITLGRVARKGLFEEVTYLGLRVPAWRGFRRWMGLDWKLLKALVSCEEERAPAGFSDYWRGDHHF